MSENRINALALAVVAVAYVAIAYYLEASFPNQPDKIIWLDASQESVRLSTRGEVGQPVADPLPSPIAKRPDLTTNPCAWIPGGSFKDANGWWHAMTPEGTAGRASLCQWNGPPPLENCNAHAFHSEQRTRNGYTCTRGGGGGLLWWPTEVRP